MFKKYDAYKDSGVDWIGEIPHDWNVVKLKHLLQEPLKYGANESGIEFSEDLPRYIRITDFNDDGKLDEKNKLSLTWKKGKDYLLDDGDILLARSGASVGKSFLFKLENANEKAFCFAGYLIKAKADINKIIPKYLYLYLNSEVFFEWKNLIFNKATIENIGADKYSEFFIILPSLDEQSKILDLLNPFLMNIDQAIAIKEQQIALLNERKQIVIQKAVTQGLYPNVPMKDSGVEWIGQIPEHWNTITKLKHIASLKGRQGWQGLKADEYIDEGPYVVSSAHFDGLDINWDKCPHVSIERYKMDAHIQLNIGDILLMKDGAKMGKMAYISNLPDLACLNSHLLLIRSLKTQDEFFFDSKYMLYFMLSEKFQDYVQVKGTGTTFMGISQESIGNFPIALPSLEEQVQITSFLDKRMLELEKGKDLLLTQIEKLKEYKTTLINDAVTGKIKVA